jgi:hypothetical protein
MRVSIPISTFREAVSGLIAKPNEREKLLTRIPEDKSPVAVFLTEEEKPLLRELLKLRLAKTARTRITQFLHQGTLNVPKQSQNALDDVPGNFDSCLDAFLDLQGKPFEVKIMDRWYPFRMPKLEMAKCKSRIVGFFISTTFQMVRATHRVTKLVLRENFKEAFGTKSLSGILAELDMRGHAEELDPEQNHSRLVSLAVGLAEDFGRQVLIRGPVLEVKADQNNNYYGGDMSWQTQKHIYEREKGVVEPELEIPPTRQNGYYGYDHPQTQMEEPDGVLPFVRVFSLRTRTYLYSDIRNVEIYPYRTDIEDRLVLEPSHRRILRQVFAADEEVLKDLIPGKTGGLCILAWGNPGVGKTLTAEVYAEIKERPLYSLSVSEIGTSPSQIERNLQRVFTRVERWNAVLLFDECDVFLSKRGANIDQAAVVGMFLRLMDYYSGTMFLTTNRFTVLDEAIDSRLAFRLHYKDLGPVERRGIWKSLLAEGKIAVDEPILDRLAQLNLDGRKIRNMVRAIQLNRTTELTWDVVEFLLPFVVVPEATSQVRK